MVAVLRLSCRLTWAGAVLLLRLRLAAVARLAGFATFCGALRCGRGFGLSRGVCAACGGCSGLIWPHLVAVLRLLSAARFVSAISGRLLPFCATLLSLSVGCLSVRPFGCLGGCGGLVWGGLVAVVFFSVVAVARPCRFEPFFCRSLPFSVVGWCLCLSVAFRGILGHLPALFGGCCAFGLWGCTPSLFLASVWGVGLPPQNFRENFSPIGVEVREAVVFFIKI